MASQSLPQTSPSPSFPSTSDSSEARTQASLKVIASDPTTSLEVTDNQGQILNPDGHSSPYEQVRWIQFSNLNPGFYRLRLIIPEGDVVEKMIDLTPNEKREEIISQPDPPPTGITRGMIDSKHIEIDSQKAMHVSEEIGPLMSSQLSTVLALAGRVVNYGINEIGAYRLRDLGLRPFQPIGAPSALQILFGWESNIRDTGLEKINRIKLRIWRLDQNVPDSFEHLIPSSKVDGLADFVSVMPPTPYWLSVEMPGQQKPLIFSLAMLRDRITMIVFHRNTDRQIRVFQYLPSISSNYSQDSPPYYPSDPPGRKLVNYRRIELLQRFYLNGRLDHAYENAWELVQAKWLDPVSGCLGAYLLLKLGKVSELQEAVSNLTSYFGELSDSHILMGEYMTSLKSHTAAKNCFLQALNTGLPIFADGLEILYDGIERYNISHPRIDLLEKMFNKRTRGLLWSAWTPDDFAPGMPL